MQITIKFSQTRRVKGQEVTSVLFTKSANLRKERDIHALIHMGCNSFERLAKVLNNAPSNARMVWSKSIPFNVEIIQDGVAVVNTDDLTAESGVRFKVNVKNASDARVNLILAADILAVNQVSPTVEPSLN